MWPRVLLACTSPQTAQIFDEALAQVCRDNGLRLVAAAPPKGEFASSEHLIETISAIPASELLDTLVLLLDVGPDVEECFLSSVNKGQSAWHISHCSKPGVGLDLTLRFPQLSLAVVSPVVPFDNSNMPLFDQFRAGIEGTTPETLCADWWKMHFASSIEEGLHGVKALIERFAHGFRTLYDPTGFRTLLRSRFLGQIFGGRESNEWTTTAGQREVLAKRLAHSVAVIDEEVDLTLLSGYSAYKHGCRVWVVNTYQEFRNTSGASWHVQRPLTVIRDLDLRFPDIPIDDVKKTAESVRQNLADVHSQEWTILFSDEKATRGLRIRVLSLDRDLVRRDESNHCDDSTGEFEAVAGKRTFAGLSKPIDSVYSIKQLLPADFREPLAAMLDPVRQSGTGSHGAPYLNLDIANSLLSQSRDLRARGGFRPSLLAALLAQEAYCLLLGMSRNTALEALREIHLGEAQAEAESLSIRHTIVLDDRRTELSAVASKVYGSGGEAWDYLAKVWSELRFVYREGEQFEAAEAANAESLVHRRWLSQRWGLPRRSLQAMEMKRLAVRVLTSIWYLLGAFVVWVLILTVLFLSGQPNWHLTWRGVVPFISVYFRVVRSICRAETLTVEDSWYFDRSLANFEFLDVVTALSSILFVGLTVSAIFRKITRG